LSTLGSARSLAAGPGVHRKLAETIIVKAAREQLSQALAKALVET
jgi:hypothetical protein